MLNFWNICIVMVYYYAFTIYSIITDFIKYHFVLLQTTSLTFIYHIKAGNLFFLLNSGSLRFFLFSFISSFFLWILLIVVGCFWFGQYILYILLFLLSIFCILCFFIKLDITLNVKYVVALITSYCSLRLIFSLFEFLYEYDFYSLFIFQNFNFTTYYIKLVIESFFFDIRFLVKSSMLVRWKFFFFCFYDYNWMTLYYNITGVRISYCNYFLVTSVRAFLYFFFGVFSFLNYVLLLFFTPIWYFELYYLFESEFTFRDFFINIVFILYNLSLSFLRISNFLTYYIIVDFDGFFIFFHFIMSFFKSLVSLLKFLTDLFIQLRLSIYPFLTFFILHAQKNDNDSNKDDNEGSSFF